MPGKHAPKSSASFIASLARAGTGALAAIGLVVVIVLIAMNSRGDGDPTNAATGGPPSPRVTRTSSPTPTPTPSPTPTQTTPSTLAPEPMIPKDRLTVEVLNGNGREGAAGEVAARLQAAGYTRVTAANASLTPRTTIYYRGALRREARRMLDEFPEFERIREASSSTPGTARLTIVLGTDHQARG